MTTPFVKVYVVPSLLVAALPALSLLSGHPVQYFTRDPAASVGHPFYIGYFSNLGVGVWAVAAVIPLYTVVLLRRQPGTGMLLAGGVLSAVFFLDDLFQLHEQVFPNYLAVSQNIVLAAYAAAIFWFLIAFRRDIGRSRWDLLGTALAFLAVSVVVDFLQDFVELPMHHVFEDGAKFLGMCGWCVFLTDAAWRRLAPRLRRQ